MYCAHVVGAILFAFAVWRYFSLGQWEAYLIPMATAALGFACVVASHQVADWTGRYGWTYERFWTYPPMYVRFFGLALLLGAVLFGFK
jgi:hypothetical protein